MDVDVDVVAPVIVAALVNWNDTVGVIDAVSDDTGPSTTRSQGLGDGVHFAPPTS